MVATPVLAGAVLRVVLGVLVDRFGPKRVGIGAQIVVIAGLLAAWFDRHPQLRRRRCCWAACSASPAPPSRSPCRWPRAGIRRSIRARRWASPAPAIPAPCWPRCSRPAWRMAFGWQNVIGLAAIPLVVDAAWSSPCSPRTARTRPPPKTFADYVSMLRIADAWWFMFFYSVTFGGFVGLASSLTIYFNDQYGLTPVIAGYCTAACVFVGSLVRPVGGAVADRVGGVRALTVLYAIAVGGVRHHRHRPVRPSALAMPVFVLGMLALGMGNGAVFQLVPQRFGEEIGVMTGLVGMTGGVGGFYLASSLGFAKQLTGSYGLGFLVFALLAAVALVCLTEVTRPLARHLGRALRRGAGLTGACHEHDRAAAARLVLVGNGMAGCARWRKSCSATRTAIAITVFGAEPHGNYNRIMLSPVLAGEKTFDDIVINDRAWYERERHRTDRRRGGRSRSTATAATVTGAQRHDAALRHADPGHRLQPGRSSRSRATTCRASSPSATSPTSSTMLGRQPHAHGTRS